jgi:hypothetical protein
MLLGYLIFAHLLGDFVFQPESLVRLKMKSMKGVFIHVLIHFALGIIVLLPFIMHGYLWLIAVIFGISFCHFWIDQAKISYNLKHDKKTKAFVIDQLLHLLTLLLAYFFVGNISLNLPETFGLKIYTNISVLIFLSFLIFLSNVVEIYRLQEVREKNADAKFKPNTENIAKRIGVFAVLYVFFMAMAFYATK